MSRELISQVLSPENATYINGVSAERRFSPAVLKNIYQGLVEKAGRGVNDKFVSEDDANSSAQVFVNRVLPIKMKPRTQGASRNGASFSANDHYVQTETVGIEILTVVDDTVIIPRARQDMIPVELLAEQTEIYSKRLNTIINGMTAGCKVLSSYLANDYNEKVISATDITNKVILDRFIEANSLLDEGDEAHGIDMFPDDTRIAVFKPSYRATLKTSGVLVIGGANYAYDIAKNGGISHEANVSKAEDGYIGDIDGVPCHIISNESLQHASEFCGLPVYELKNGSWIGYIASSYANARGVSTLKQTKIVDAIAGQGLVFQPYTKMGCACWYPKGNVMLTSKANGYDLFSGVKTLLSGASITGVEFKLKAGGSRLFADIEFTAISSSAFTCKAEAKTDAGYDEAKGLFFCVSDKACDTVEKFLTEYGTATYKGTFTSASSKATTVGTNYVNILVVASDGSMTVASKKA